MSRPRRRQPQDNPPRPGPFDQLAQPTPVPRRVSLKNFQVVVTRPGVREVAVSPRGRYDDMTVHLYVRDGGSLRPAGHINCTLSGDGFLLYVMMYDPNGTQLSQVVSGRD